MSGALMIGVDAHKRTHTFASADEVGRQLATRTLAATSEGHLAALEWGSSGHGAPGRSRTAVT